MPDDPDKLWINWKPKDPTKTEASIEAILSDEYKDAGYWARHYSGVRLTLGTFFLTAATAIISQRLDKPDWRYAIVAAVIAFMGLLLFCLFSSLTFKEMNRQRDIINSYRQHLLSGPEKQQLRKYAWWNEYSGGWIVVGFLLLFSVYLIAWLCHGFAPKQTMTEAGQGHQVQLGLEVKVGTSDPVMLQIPVTVTAKPDPQQ